MTLRELIRNTVIVGLLMLAILGVRLLRSEWTQRERERLTTQQYESPPAGMVLVPAGEFWMGSDDEKAEPDERPRRKVFVPAFYIDRLEVTNRRYRELMPQHKFEDGEEDLPVTHVLKSEAEEFCRRAGGRLPTGAEWEKAARGTDGRVYPWGDEFKPGLANLGLGRDDPGKLRGGSFPGGASPYGCEDMCGNVWEWVSDVRAERVPFERAAERVEHGVIRGGAHGYGTFQGRASYQGFEGNTTTCHDVGFRCVMDAVPKGK
ncbi:MAG: formylglycine-generating enzyme family protein [Verrucomicrobia bacterium]|nr:formylglycine-generating enzyme family protein [Verrucomicrobiota bacterium]